MGMYNEVRKNCPECGATAESQIGQVVPSFGDFHLDYPKEGSFTKLTHEQKGKFAEYVNNTLFYCKNHKCENSFYVNVKIGSNDERIIYI